jgi:hypothetical protein
MHSTKIKGIAYAKHIVNSPKAKSTIHVNSVNTAQHFNAFLD